MTKDTVSPYRVEVENAGCERCSCGKTWTVVGPDEWAIGQTFENERRRGRRSPIS